MRTGLTKVPFPVPDIVSNVWMKIGSYALDLGVYHFLHVRGRAHPVLQLRGFTTFNFKFLRLTFAVGGKRSGLSGTASEPHAPSQCALRSCIFSSTTTTTLDNCNLRSQQLATCNPLPCTGASAVILDQPASPERKEGKPVFEDTA